MRARLLIIADIVSCALIAGGLALMWLTDLRGDYLLVAGLPIAFVVTCIRFFRKTPDGQAKKSN